MAIHLDRQRPPTKKMGRKQRMGSKSNPRTGVQWANWLDIPGSGGGGTPAPAPVLTLVTPNPLVINTPVTLTVDGTGFTGQPFVMIKTTGAGGAGSFYGATLVSATQITVAAFQLVVAGSYDVAARNGVSGVLSNVLPLTVAAATADPTSSWTKHEIVAWLQAHDVAIGDNAVDNFSKAELLEIVEAYLNGDPVDDLIGG
jgi:hypothetical protein